MHNLGGRVPSKDAIYTTSPKNLAQKWLGILKNWSNQVIDTQMKSSRCSPQVQKNPNQNPMLESTLRKNNQGHGDTKESQCRFAEYEAHQAKSC